MSHQYLLENSRSATLPSIHRPLTHHYEITAMSTHQMGQTQYLVNLDESQSYKLLKPGDRKKLQQMKHDLNKNGIYDPDAQAILNKYKHVRK